MPHGGLKGALKCGIPLDAGEEPRALHRYILLTPGGFPILHSSWTNWCLGRPRRTYTPVLYLYLYTGLLLLCKGCWDGGSPLSPPVCGRIHLFSFPGNLDLNQLTGIKCLSSPFYCSSIVSNMQLPYLARSSYAGTNADRPRKILPQKRRGVDKWSPLV